MLGSMTRPRRWTDEDLREAVQTSTTYSAVMAKLGISRGGRSLEAIRNRMLELNLDLKEPQRGKRSTKWLQNRSDATSTGQPRTWSDADLAEAVAASWSVAGVIRALGLQIGGSRYVTIKRRIAELGLDTSHFTGRGWTRGRRNPTRGSTRSLESILTVDSDYTNSNRLKQRLVREGLLAWRCACCSLERWRGEPVALQLDHINGLRTDNRLDNLRLLCPNCHAQTDTWCGRNRGRYDAGRSAD